MEGSGSGGTTAGTIGILDCCFGRVAELMSPVPTKNSSRGWVSRKQHRSRTKCRTWDHFHQMGTPIPNIRSVVDYNDHTLIRREESFKRLESFAYTHVRCKDITYSASQLTAALIPCEDTFPKPFSAGVKSVANSIRIGSCAHRVDVHFVQLGYCIHELGKARPERQC